MNKVTQLLILRMIICTESKNIIIYQSDMTKFEMMSHHNLIEWLEVADGTYSTGLVVVHF